MSTLDDIAQERQRIAERIARLDGERTRLAEELAELEVTERVLARFGQPTGPRRRGRPPKSAGPLPQRRQRRPRGTTPPARSTPALGDATLQAVQAHGEGPTADEVRQYLAATFGIEVRPNHLGMALQRHRRAGRLEQRDARWWLPAA